MKPRAGISRAAWWTLALLPLVAWIMMLTIASTRKPEIPATGDELFDETIRLFAELDTSGLNLRFLDESRRRIQPNMVRTIEGWESRFGEDPRYWMLKYHAIDLCRDYSEDRNQDDLVCLEEARRRGVADASILMRILSRYKHQWTSGLQYISEPETNATRGTAYLRRTEKIRADWDYIFEHHQAEYDQLTAELLAVGADQCRTHYYLAQLAAEQGNYGEAIRLYAVGNRLDGNIRVVGFPFDDVYALLRSGRPLPDEYAIGAIGEAEVAVAIPNYIRIKDLFKLLADDAIARQDLQALDELHTYACRMGQDPNGCVIHGLMAAVLVGIIEDKVSTGLELTSDQVKALADLNLKMGTAQAAVRNVAQQGSTMYSSRNPTSFSPSFYAEGLLSRGISVDVWFKLNVWLVELQTDQVGLAGPARRAFEDLEEFDYPKLGWEH